RIEAERLAGRDGDTLRVPHLARVGVDGGRLLSDRQLDPHPVVERPAAGWRRHHLVVLACGKPLERRRPDHLQPHGSPEGKDEHERQDCEDEANAAVRQPRAHFGGKSTNVVALAGAGTRCSSDRACAWIFAAANPLESSDESSAMSAWRRVRLLPSRSSSMFERSTARFMKTTPASRTAMRAIMTTPPATRGRR